MIDFALRRTSIHWQAMDVTDQRAAAKGETLRSLVDWLVGSGSRQINILEKKLHTAGPPPYFWMAIM